MSFVALRMLVGDRAKYLAIVAGLTFTALLLTQQLSIFVGLLERSWNPVRDIQGADLWVMDERVAYIDDFHPMPDTQLHRVRGVPGIESAVPLFRVFGTARVPGGEQKQVAIVGLDDGSLLGAPEVMVQGRLEDLRRPDAVIVQRSLTGLSDERVDTRVLEVVYAVSGELPGPLYVGQQVDAFIAAR